MAPPRIKLGELLVRAKVISDAQVKTALQEQQKWGGKLGEILVRMNYLTEDVLVKALCKQLNLPRADLDRYPTIPRSVLARVPPAVAKEYNVLPLAATEDGKSLAICVSDPLNLQMLDELRSVTGGTRLVTYVAGATAIARAIAQKYDGEESLDDVDPAGSLDMIDAQGRSIDRTPLPVSQAAARPAARPAPAPAAAPPAPAPASGPPRSAAAMLAQMEEMQQREIAALKALVEVLIDKGVFSREEYLSRVRK